MLTRVDEFVGMLDMVSEINITFVKKKLGFGSIALNCSTQQIRNDTSQIVNENLPQIQQKSDEMRQIYRRVDKLEVRDNVNSVASTVELFLRHAGGLITDRFKEKLFKGFLNPFYTTPDLRF